MSCSSSFTKGEQHSFPAIIGDPGVDSRDGTEIGTYESFQGERENFRDVLAEFESDEITTFSAKRLQRWAEIGSQFSTRRRAGISTKM